MSIKQQINKNLCPNVVPSGSDVMTPGVKVHKKPYVLPFLLAVAVQQQ